MKVYNRVFTAKEILCTTAIAMVYCISVIAMQPALGQSLTERLQAAQEPQQPSSQEPDPNQKLPKKTVVMNGTIVRSGDAFVLRDTSGTDYRLDDQEKAAFFAGKSVKVTGKLEASINLLHVESIEEAMG
jgi:hypothetical protein